MQACIVGTMQACVVPADQSLTMDNNVNLTSGVFWMFCTITNEHESYIGCFKPIICPNYASMGQRTVDIRCFIIALKCAPIGCIKF